MVVNQCVFTLRDEHIVVGVKHVCKVRENTITWRCLHTCCSSHIQTLVSYMPFAYRSTSCFLQSLNVLMISFMGKKKNSCSKLNGYLYITFYCQMLKNVLQPRWTNINSHVCILSPFVVKIRTCTQFGCCFSTPHGQSSHLSKNPSFQETISGAYPPRYYFRRLVVKDELNEFTRANVKEMYVNLKCSQR